METARQVRGNGFTINRDSLDIEFWPDFLPALKADLLLNALSTETPWQHADIAIYGKRVKMPRLTRWYGDPNATYVYSGLRNEPKPWTPALSKLRADVEAVTGNRFNSVLLNYYRDGNDYMSWHSDDEPELGSRPMIASVSLGAPRRFDFRQARPQPAGSRKTYSLDLPHGSLLLMRGDTQAEWQHGIAKVRGVTAPRINLTFRLILPKS